MRDRERTERRVELVRGELRPRVIPMQGRELKVPILRPTRQDAQYLFEMLLGVDAVQPAGCDHGEDGRCALGMSVAAIKHPILRPNNRGGSTTRVRRKCALSVEHTCLACVRARR